MLLTTTGQWMQEDPKTFDAGDSNLRRDVGNDPTNMVDPSGLEPNGANYPFKHERGHAGDKQVFDTHESLLMIGKSLFKVTAKEVLWSKDDTVGSPTVAHVQFTVSVDPADKVGQALLKHMHWIQFGTVDRYRDTERKQLANTSGFWSGQASYPSQKVLKDDSDALADIKVKYGTVFVDNQLATSPYVTDNKIVTYKRTDTELTCWDAPNAMSEVSTTYPQVVQTFVTFLTIQDGLEEYLLYGAGWEAVNTLGEGVKYQARNESGIVKAAGGIVLGGKTFYQAEGLPEVPNPITGLPPKSLAPIDATPLLKP
jgi:hypothetical protein